MKFLPALPPLVVGLVLLSGCQSATDSVRGASLIFARGDVEERSYFVQALGGSEPPAPLDLPRGTGNVQTAAGSTIAAATVGGATPASAELRLFSLGEWTVRPRVLAAEWAWDFALRADGGAIAWVAGRDRRQLFIARAPAWTPAVVPLAGDATPGEPRWLDAERILVVLRRAGRSALVVVSPGGGEARVVYQAIGDASLSEVARVPGSDDVLVVEIPAAAGRGRLLRMAVAGGEPRVLAQGFFQPGSVTVSPDGRHVAEVWSDDLAALRRREAALQWIGEPWVGAPAAIPGVVSLAWNAAGTHLAVARQSDGRRWIEVYAAGAAPRGMGFAEAACFAPQWWQPRP